MKKSFAKTLLSLILALSIIIGCCPVIVYAATTESSEAADSVDPDIEIRESDAEDPETEPESVTSYSDFIDALTVLEGYAASYALEHPSEEPVALVINYIRTGVEKYNSGTWNTFCGEEKTDFTSFVAEQDELNGTNASSLRDLGLFTLPNGNQVEFSHMFGCMDMAYHTGNQATADLGSWAGDICDLLQLSQNYGVTGTVEEMAEQIRTDNEHLFLYDNPSAHSFGLLDYYGDLDAFYILNRLNGGNTISQIMKNYFTVNLNDSFRAAFFLENRLGGARTKSDMQCRF
jgi:hypothetical protein